MKTVRFTLRITGFVLLLLAGAIIATLLFHRRNRDYHHHKTIVRRWMACCTWLMGCKPEVNRPETEMVDGSLLVANHISWLDIFVVGGTYQVRFLSKAEIRSWPLFGWLSAISGTLFIERGSGSDQAAQAITQALRAGDNVMLFPESTTTSGISVKPFHPRLFKSALQTGRPVVPLLISYPGNGTPDTSIAWNDSNHFTHTLWNVLSRKSTRVIVEQFAPVMVDPGESRTVLAKKCHSKIQHALEQLYD
jgi:1-acyl-sn-glycerol-3-phosphate acyltransferase